MKPNGMRAWRKMARRWRRKQNRHWRETGAPCVADGTGRWYRRQQAFFKQRPAAPSRPFTPRSLVGMTQSARKRAAERLCDVTFIPFPNCKANRLALRRELAGKLRIGQRLRPCPNPFCSKEDGCSLRGCHGSGVLPANR